MLGPHSLVMRDRAGDLSYPTDGRLETSLGCFLLEKQLRYVL
jgi:hypothetical protein